MTNIVEITSEILELVKEFELEEFELETKDTKIRLSTVPPTANAINIPATAPVAAQPIVQVNSAVETMPEPIEEDSDLITISSPMIGTFYRKPSPERPPYAEVGQRVDPGQTVCIIEAMKLMNEIKADQGGKIIKILVKNEETVHEGQPLFLVEAE